MRINYNQNTSVNGSVTTGPVSVEPYDSWQQSVTMVSPPAACHMLGVSSKGNNAPWRSRCDSAASSPASFKLLTCSGTATFPSSPAFPAMGRAT